VHSLLPDALRINDCYRPADADAQESALAAATRDPGGARGARAPSIAPWRTSTTPAAALTPHQLPPTHQKDVRCAWPTPASRLPGAEPSRSSCVRIRQALQRRLVRLAGTDADHAADVLMKILPSPTLPVFAALDNCLDTWSRSRLRTATSNARLLARKSTTLSAPAIELVWPR